MTKNSVQDNRHPFISYNFNFLYSLFVLLYFPLYHKDEEWFFLLPSVIIRPVFSLDIVVDLFLHCCSRFLFLHDAEASVSIDSFSRFLFCLHEPSRNRCVPKTKHGLSGIEKHNIFFKE